MDRNVVFSGKIPIAFINECVSTFMKFRTASLAHVEIISRINGQSNIKILNPTNTRAPDTFDRSILNKLFKIMAE